MKEFATDYEDLVDMVGIEPTTPSMFRTVFASQLVSSRSNRIVDIGLTFTPIEKGGLEQMSGRTERLSAVVSQDGTLVGKPAVTLADMKSHPLIVAACERARSILYARLLKECQASGFRPTIAEEATYRSALRNYRLDNLTLPRSTSKLSLIRAHRSSLIFLLPLT